MWGRNEIENPRAIELRAGSIVIIDFQPIYTSSSSSSSSPSLSVVEDVPSESLPDCPEVSKNQRNSSGGHFPYQTGIFGNEHYLPVFASMAYRNFHLFAEPLALGFVHSLKPHDFKTDFLLSASSSPLSIHGQTTFFSNASLTNFFIWPSKMLCGSADHLHSALK